MPDLRRHAVQRGFTLIEAMVVIAVTGLLLAIGLPELANFSAARATASQANTLAGTLRLARAEAIKRGRPVTLCPSSAPEAADPDCDGGPDDWGNGWIVFSDAGVLRAVDGGDRIIRVQPAWTNGGAIRSASPNGQVGVTFFPNGIAVGGQRDFSVLARAGSITETVESLSVRLCTDPTGTSRTMPFTTPC